MAIPNHNTSSLIWKPLSTPDKATGIPSSLNLATAFKSSVIAVESIVAEAERTTRDVLPSFIHVSSSLIPKPSHNTSFKSLYGSTISLTCAMSCSLSQEIKRGNSPVTTF